ncbi:MAG: Na+/H+ antiporter NhaA [Chloroflexi bacterium]|nr:Na+/H+ antiporter NhaA [Chloroflexota bacterium]
MPPRKALAHPEPALRSPGRALADFIATEVASGLVLVVAVVVALVWANSPWAASYHALWSLPVTVAIGEVGLAKPLQRWINDGLMTIFFLLVGLEIKRELRHGELASPRRAALPIAAALGGMVVPAALYLAFNPTGPATRGWAVPMATDIALALGVLALLGRRVAAELRIFLLALAIVDDIGAILVIALFYSGPPAWPAILGGALIYGLVLLAVRAGVRSRVVFTLLGVLFWLAVLASGVHATIAGVLLALLVPAAPARAPEQLPATLRALLTRSERGQPGEETTLPEQLAALARQSSAPLERLEHALHPWVSYLIVPVFALANAGVSLRGTALAAAAADAVTHGVAVGLLVGKPVGIVFAAALAVRLGLAVLPAAVGWGQLLGAGLLAGIGFTVALFVNELAFAGQPAAEAAKVGILAASLIAASAGLALLRFLPAPAGKASALPGQNPL